MFSPFCLYDGDIKMSLYTPVVRTNKNTVHTSRDWEHDLDGLFLLALDVISRKLCALSVAMTTLVLTSDSVGDHSTRRWFVLSFLLD